MKPHLQYLRYVLRHKWFVLVAGLRVGDIPIWRLLIHDWSKFSPAEWGPYVRYFYGPVPQTVHDNPVSESSGHLRGNPETEKKARRLAFDRGWLHHQHKNPHHWQHWILREDSGDTKILEMPEHFAREMVADWMGAGRAITGKWEAAEWYEKNQGKIQLAPITRLLVVDLLRRNLT